MAIAYVLLNLTQYNAPMTRKHKIKAVNATEQTATITGLSHEGRGIAHVDDKITFIFNALPGETVQFHYTKQRNQVAEGAATTVTNPSSYRVDPICPHFTICGGCSLQHMTDAYQQETKLTAVLALLTHHQIKPNELLPTLTGPSSGYRRKARIGVKFLNH